MLIQLKKLCLNHIIFLDRPKIFNVDDQKKVWKENTEEVLKNIIQFLENIESVKSQNLESMIKNYIETCGFSFGEVLKPMRLALCGSLTGPSLFDLIELIGIEESIFSFKSFYY